MDLFLSIYKVELGLQQEEYTICEGDLYVIVCLELFSGQLASTVELSANLSTQDYNAQGMDVLIINTSCISLR